MLAGLVLGACAGGGTSIEGVVRVEGASVRGATVRLLPAQDDAVPTGEEEAATVLAEERTDSQGRFAFKSVDPGEYAVSVLGITVEGVGTCNALHPFLNVEEGSATVVDFDTPPLRADGPGVIPTATGLLAFINPFWVLCSETQPG